MTVDIAFTKSTDFVIYLSSRGRHIVIMLSFRLGPWIHTPVCNIHDSTILYFKRANNQYVKIDEIYSDQTGQALCVKYNETVWNDVTFVKSYSEEVHGGTCVWILIT